MFSTSIARGGGGYDCSVAQTQIPTAECDALVALYNSAGGGSWTDKSGWLNSSTPCSWYEVTCTTGNVTTLSLTGNNLVGSIPTLLGNLTSLQYLYLSNNGLTGGMPTQMGSLSSLVELNLYNNSLSGSIPTQLGDLSNLTLLILGNNSLAGSIPTELGNLSNLIQLNLSSNSLDGNIPTQLGDLSNLTHLTLSSNGLTGGIPTQLGNLSNLTQLNLQNNSLTSSIPTELGDLSNLQYLWLHNNSLTGGIPTQLGSLSNLIQLYLFSNGLTGSIPVELGNISGLQRIYLYGNSLSGNIPVELGNLSNLTILFLQDNNIDGTIPVELGNLSSLQFLHLYDNNLTGGIPTELGNLSNLQYLDLGGNNLAGYIPTELGSLTNLINLLISDNAGLNGWLPSNLTNLTGLTNFWFSGTSLCERPDTAFQDWLDTVDLAGSVISTDVVCNVIFADGFESNDFTAWVGLNTGNGDLNVCAAAAMEGSFGACVDVVSNKRKQVWDQSMTDAASYQAHFYFDPNGLSMGDNEKIRLMQLRTGSDTIRPAFVQVRYKDGGYEIRVRAQTDAGTTLSGSWYPISDAPVAIDIDWMAATGDGNDDGYVTLWLDGVEKGTISGIDNDTLLVNEVKLGFTSRLGTKIISGTFYLDGFVSSDDGFIGP